jgi:hypothetical protein
MIIKNIDSLNSEEIPFSPSKQSNCYIITYWKKIKIYLPDEECRTRNNKTQDIVVTNLENSYDAVSFDGLLWVNYKSSIFDDDFKYGLKHELGHKLGALDADFIEIAPNSIFPVGNTKKNTVFDDVMYSYGNINVGPFTKATINNVINYDTNNINNFFPLAIYFVLSDQNLFWSLKTAQFVLYGGVAGPSHFPGTITSSPICSGRLSGNTFLLDQQCPAFLKSKYVAGFFLIRTNGQLYETQFDMIDMNMAYFEKKPNLELSLKSRSSPKDDQWWQCSILKNECENKGLNDRCDYNTTCKVCIPSNPEIDTFYPGYCYHIKQKINEVKNLYKGFSTVLPPIPIISDYPVNLPIKLK